MTQPPRPFERTRYFRSFSAIRYPVKPLDELSLEEAKNLVTYYEATYSEQDRLSQFQKHLLEEHDGVQRWTIAFSERYEYWDDGSVMRRSLSATGQADQMWEYSKKHKLWSEYFDRFCAYWFGANERAAEGSFAKQALLFHEQFTELETDVFPLGFEDTTYDPWPQETMIKLIEGFREIVMQVTAGERIQICVIGHGESTDVWLKGFDDPPISFLGIVDDARERLGRLEPGILLPSVDFDEAQRAWAHESNVGTITTAQVKIVDAGETIEAFTLFVVMCSELDEDRTIVVNSLTRRFALTIQHGINHALTVDFIRKNIKLN